MHFLLLVLGIIKGILWIAFFLLALALALLLLLLFVPFGYDVSAGVAGDLSGTGKFSWLFRLVQVIYRYSACEDTTIVKILFIPVRKIVTKKVKSDVKKAPAKDDKNDVAPESAQKTEMPKQDKKMETRGEDGKKERKSPGHIIEKARSGWETAKAYEVKAILRILLDLLKKLWRAVKPRKFSLRGVVGTGDPCGTGQLLGALAVCRAFTRCDMRIDGDFEQPTFQLNARLAGHFRLIAIALPLLSAMLKKPIWRLIKPILFRKGERV